jgi:hypothetical protein
MFSKIKEVLNMQKKHEPNNEGKSCGIDGFSNIYYQLGVLNGKAQACIDHNEFLADFVEGQQKEMLKLIKKGVED